MHKVKKKGRPLPEPTTNLPSFIVVTVMRTGTNFLIEEIESRGWVRGHLNDYFETPGVVWWGHSHWPIVDNLPDLPLVTTRRNGEDMINTWIRRSHSLNKMMWQYERWCTLVKPNAYVVDIHNPDWAFLDEMVKYDP